MALGFGQVINEKLQKLHDLAKFFAIVQMQHVMCFDEQINHLDECVVFWNLCEERRRKIPIRIGNNILQNFSNQKFTYTKCSILDVNVVVSLFCDH